jgi:hypothetical protein
MKNMSYRIILGHMPTFLDHAEEVKAVMMIGCCKNVTYLVRANRRVDPDHGCFHIRSTWMLCQNEIKTGKVELYGVLPQCQMLSLAKQYAYKVCVKSKIND